MVRVFLQSNLLSVIWLTITNDIADEFYTRVDKIALTDSWAISRSQLNDEQAKWMLENCIHYVASDRPLGEEINRSYGSDVCVEKSAGHIKHEYTTGYAFDEIVKQFGYKL